MLLTPGRGPSSSNSTPQSCARAAVVCLLTTLTVANCRGPPQGGLHQPSAFPNHHNTDTARWPGPKLLPWSQAPSLPALDFLKLGTPKLQSLLSFSPLITSPSHKHRRAPHRTAQHITAPLPIALLFKVFSLPRFKISFCRCFISSARSFAPLGHTTTRTARHTTSPTDHPTASPQHYHHNGRH